MAMVSPDRYRVEQITVQRSLRRTPRPNLRVTWRGFWIADCASVYQVSCYVALATLTEEPEPAKPRAGGLHTDATPAGMHIAQPERPARQLALGHLSHALGWRRTCHELSPGTRKMPMPGLSPPRLWAARRIPSSPLCYERRSYATASA
jgi:hypothetical protein